MTKYEDVPQFGNLKGMKVVVSAVSTAGPFAGELFAENGADVIWLESPKGIDRIDGPRMAGACKTSGATCEISCSTWSPPPVTRSSSSS